MRRGLLALVVTVAASVPVTNRADEPEKVIRLGMIEGNLSTALVHMANASYRVGTSHSVDEVRDAIKDRGSEAVKTFGRVEEHLAANGVDFSKSQVTLGPWLEMDAVREEFVGGGDAVSQANQVLRGRYRKPFVVPEEV